MLDLKPSKGALRIGHNRCAHPDSSAEHDSHFPSGARTGLFPADCCRGSGQTPFISVVIPEINVLQVERITQKHPSPAQIRPQAVRRIRREGNALSFAVSERIFLVGIGVLQHHRIIVMLVFYISRIRTVEFSEEPGEHISHLMEEGFAMALFHEAVLGIGHEHRLVEERSQHGRIHGLPCPCRSADKGTDKSYYTETSLHNLRSNPDDDFVKISSSTILGPAPS